MSEIPASVIAEFGKYPNYARSDNLTRSIFDISLRDTLSALVNQDDALPLLAAHCLRREFLTAPNWETCLRFVTETLIKVAENPAKYAQDTTNATRNSSRFDQLRAESTGMLFHNQYSEDPLHEICKSLSYGLLWAYERNQYQQLDLASKIVGTFSVRNQLGAYLQGDHAGEVVQPALVLNSAINGVLLAYDLQVNDSYSCDGRYFWAASVDDGSGLEILEHNQLEDRRVSQSALTDTSIEEFCSVAHVSVDASGALAVDGPARYQELINTSE